MGGGRRSRAPSAVQKLYAAGGLVGYEVMALAKIASFGHLTVDCGARDAAGVAFQQSATDKRFAAPRGQVLWHGSRAGGNSAARILTIPDFDESYE